MKKLLLALMALAFCSCAHSLTGPHRGESWYAERDFHIPLHQSNVEFVCGNEFSKHSVWIGHDRIEYSEMIDGERLPVRVESKHPYQNLKWISMKANSGVQCAFGEVSAIGSKVWLVEPDWLEMTRLSSTKTLYVFVDDSRAVLNYPLTDADRSLLISAGISSDVARSLY